MARDAIFHKLVVDDRVLDLVKSGDFGSVDDRVPDDIGPQPSPQPRNPTINLQITPPPQQSSYRPL